MILFLHIIEGVILCHVIFLSLHFVVLILMESRQNSANNLLRVGMRPHIDTDYRRWRAKNLLLAVERKNFVLLNITLSPNHVTGERVYIVQQSCSFPSRSSTPAQLSRRRIIKFLKNTKADQNERFYDISTTAAVVDWRVLHINARIKYTIRRLFKVQRTGIEISIR